MCMLEEEAWAGMIISLPGFIHLLDLTQKPKCSVNVITVVFSSKSTQFSM